MVPNPCHGKWTAASFTCMSEPTVYEHLSANQYGALVDPLVHPSACLCVAAGILASLDNNALQTQVTNSLTPSNSPLPPSKPSRYRNIQLSCLLRTTAVLSNRELWPNILTPSLVTSYWKAHWMARPPLGCLLQRWAVCCLITTLV